VDAGLASILVAGLSLAGTLLSLGVSVLLSARVAETATRVNGLIEDRDKLTERAAGAEGEMRGRDFTPPPPLGI
jgi:hypothetical protein